MPFTGRRGRGITGQLWYACMRCGFDYPENELQWQNGGRVCEKCFHKELTFSENFEKLRIPPDDDTTDQGVVL